jgi:hypothetical protein
MSAPPSADCPNMSTCSMFKIFTLAGTLRIWQDNYCRGEYKRCARFESVCSGSGVPDNLLPNGTLLKKLA